MTRLPPKYLPADERRSLTVDTVVTLAGQQNPSEITTAAIAEHMRVTQGALFRHFPTKDAIWQAVMQWIADRLLDRFDRAVSGIASPVESLRAAFLSQVEFAIEHSGVPRLMFGELQHAKATPAKTIARTLVARYTERIKQRIEEAKAAGEVDRDIDSTAAAILFIGTIQGLVMQSLLSGDIAGARTHAAAVVAIYLRGLKRWPPEPSGRRSP